MSEYCAYLLKKMARLADTKSAKDKIIAEQQAYIETLVEQRDLYKEIADAAIAKYGVQK